MLNRRDKKLCTIPDFISPMLATLIDHAFDDDNWLFEIKWDGFRSLSFIKHGVVTLVSRNQLLFNKKFPEIVRELEKIDSEIILDGEIVVVDEKGRSHFQLIQNYDEHKDKTHLLYYVFDLLYENGQDLRELPLIERKKRLKALLTKLSLPSVRYSDHIIGKGNKFFSLAVREKLEGIIGKKSESSYQSKRSDDWVKIKTVLRQEVVIGGFTEPKGSREWFGSLIVGIYDDQGQLVSTGHVGSGFNRQLLHDVYHELEPLIQKKCPFATVPKVNAPATWVKPKLMAEVTFSEWTKDNQMRHPIFQGLREDKSPKLVKKEMPKRV